MKSLESSITYTREIMSHKIQTMKKSYYESAINDLDSYLMGKEDDTSVSFSFEHISNWLLWEFIYEYTNSQRVNFDLLAQSTFYGLWANKWEYAIGLISEYYDDCLMFKYSASHLGQLLFLGYDKEMQSYLSLLKTMLNGKQSENFAKYPVYTWFILNVCLKLNGEDMSEKWSKPDSLGIYDKILTNWNSQNKSLIDNLIHEACAYHIWASNDDSCYQKPDDDGLFDFEKAGYELLEFDSADYFLFPVEILTWLCVRKKLGLYAGKNNLPELLHLGINIPPERPVAVPHSKLVQQCVNKLKKDNPNIQFDILIKLL